MHRHSIVSIYFFFICTSTATTAHLLLPYIARYDLANAILYFAYCKYSEQLASHASEFVSIRRAVARTYIQGGGGQAEAPRQANCKNISMYIV